MRRSIFLITLLIFLGMSACNTAQRSKVEAEEGETAGLTAEVIPAAPNTLTELEKRDGWILMFDGESTEGWRGYGLEKFPGQGWSIDDGTIKCSNEGDGKAGFGGDIIYDKQFTNFHLKVDWMIEEGGNSGIFLLGAESDEHKIWYTAPEYQILDNHSNHIDNKLGVDGNRRAGSLYDLIASDPALYKGPMKWHSAEIICYEGTVVFKLNGTTTMEFSLWTPEWEEMVANSKFPGLNETWADVAKEGYIGLQDHGDDVWFRSIKIREL